MVKEGTSDDDNEYCENDDGDGDPDNDRNFDDSFMMIKP